MDGDEVLVDNLVHVSQARVGRFNLEETVGLRNRIDLGGGTVDGADPGVIKPISITNSHVETNLSDTIREAEKHSNNISKSISNGFYNKLLLKDCRESAFKYEGRRRVDTTLNLEEIYVFLSGNRERNTKNHLRGFLRLCWFRPIMYTNHSSLIMSSWFPARFTADGRGVVIL